MTTSKRIKTQIKKSKYLNLEINKERGREGKERKIEKMKDRKIEIERVREIL